MSDFLRKDIVERLSRRVRNLVDNHNVALSAIALKACLRQDIVKSIYEPSNASKKNIFESTGKKIDEACDEIETSKNLVKACSKCGITYPIGRFHRRSSAKDGHSSVCPACKLKYKRQKKQEDKEKAGSMNLGKDVAITKEIVQKVKAEDKSDVESKYMAAYFGIKPAQLDEIRRGVWDKLLLTPKEPKRADTVLASVEELRKEVALLRREIEAVLIEFGINVGDAN